MIARYHAAARHGVAAALATQERAKARGVKLGTMIVLKTGHDFGVGHTAVVSTCD